MIKTLTVSSLAITAICASYRVRIIPTSQRCADGDTHAGGAIASIFKQKGAAHLDLVLACVTADPANRNALWSETIGAVSDCLVFRSDWTVERLQIAFRCIDLQKHRNLAVRLRPWPVRHSLRSIIDRQLDERKGTTGLPAMAEGILRSEI